MGTRSWRKRVAAAALLGAVPMLAGATGLTSNWQARVLAAQNRERAALGLAPLHWSEDLSVSAQGWADHLARTGRFEHAPDKPVDPEGENIWGGTKGYYSADAMVDGWLVEKRHFHPGVFPNNSTTGQIKDVGHYTQIVWRDSRTVGCALARSREEDLLVCRYAQAGNWIGERPY
jgi:hypothetical protein